MADEKLVKEEPLEQERLTKEEAPVDVGEGGCVCQYVPDELRNEVWIIAEQNEAYTAQVAVAALRIGLAALMGKIVPVSELERINGKSPKKTRKGRLSGAGV